MGYVKTKEEYYDEVKAVVESKNGKLISTEYTTAKSNLDVICVNGHSFTTNANSIKNGNWCGKCPRIKYTTEDLNNLALRNQGVCLSTEYKGYKENYRWKCKNGHEWEETYYYVKNFNQWCKKCKKEATKLSRSVIEDRVKRKGGFILNSKRGEILGTDYLQLVCFKGHKFRRTVGDLIYKNDRWCAECNRIKFRKIEYYRLKKFASNRGYKLSEKFSSYILKDSGEKYEFICPYNHRWKCGAANFKKYRNCSTCLQINRRIKEDEILTIVNLKEGKLLTPYEKYRHSKQKLLWRCSQGHEFFANLDGVFRGSWCTTCNAKFINELKCKYIIEQLTGFEFIKTRSILTSKVNSDIKKFLELDMYNKTLHVALEYNGEQHYKYIEYFHNDMEGFYNSQKRDAIKQQTCDKLKIKLIIVPFNINSDDDKIEFIRNELERMNVPIQKSYVNMNDYYKKGGTINDH